MLTAPYSIYVNKRPLRIAFLVEDKPESLKIVDTILADNRTRWGGRYNPVIITDGQSLTENWWALLEAIDPDIVKSFVTLSDNFIANIDRRISPLLIQQPDRIEIETGYRSLNLHNPGISILPTAKNIKVANWSIGESTFILFETDSKKTDPLIKQFVERNFGGYSDSDRAVINALDGVCTQPYLVTDATSLLTPLTSLGAFRNFTYPIQLCSIPKDALPPVKYDRLNEIFHVVIGDSLSDVAYFWNHPSTIPQQNRTYMNQIWLPLGIATNPQLTTALSLWLKRWADPRGNGQSSIRFVSLSLPQEQLQKIASTLTCNLHLQIQMTTLLEMQPPKLDETANGLPNHVKLDRYATVSTKEQLSLQEPDVSQGPSLDEYWMADLYIEFRPERFPTISGKPFWWQLPRLNGLAGKMFNNPARVLQTRYPSVLMKRGLSHINITLLDESSILLMLATIQNSFFYAIDARHEKSIPGRTPFYQAYLSEKGRYLSGLFDLFGGLHQATLNLEDRYWRCMYDLLSGRTAHEDIDRLKEIGNTLRKRLGANRAHFYEEDKPMTWLSHYVLKVARNLPAPSRDLKFSYFEKFAKQELEEFNTHHSNQDPRQYSRSDLIEAMSFLTERGILLMGVKAKCPSCGSRAWHHINEAKQTLLCSGCNAVFPIEPEPCWYYRLNTLARAAIAEHGLVPVILVLGQLLMDAKSAFIFAPCLDLFEHGNDKPYGDLDIAVILDGKFIIGEIKQTRDLYDTKSFNKMEEIAKRLLPDVLLFASMDRDPSPFIQREVARLSDNLKPLNVAVRWYQLHPYKFEAFPIT